MFYVCILCFCKILKNFHVKTKRRPQLTRQTPTFQTPYAFNGMDPSMKMTGMAPPSYENGAYTPHQGCSRNLAFFKNKNTVVHSKNFKISGPMHDRQFSNATTVPQSGAKAGTAQKNSSDSSPTSSRSKVPAGQGETTYGDWFNKVSFGIMVIQLKFQKTRSPKTSQRTSHRRSVRSASRV